MRIFMKLKETNKLIIFHRPLTSGILDVCSNKLSNNGVRRYFRERLYFSVKLPNDSLITFDGGISGLVLI